MLRTFAAVLVIATTAHIQSLQAQDASPGTGRVGGKVLNAVTGEGVPSAQVTVEGTAIAAITNWSGEYVLANVPAGSRTVSVRAIGYASKFVEAVAVRAGATTALDVTLSGAAVELEGITVTVEEERGSVSYALNQQRAASQIINAVTSEQIKRSPDSDAGQAVQRVSGVTVQDGKYVFVRGLGERYTTTALNSARMPSPEPDRKVVPFDLFPSSLLESITTAKTFTPDQPGDFSGASVNLKTRDFPLHNVFTVSASGGVNTGGADLPHAPTVGREWLGFAGDARDIPAAADAIRTPTDVTALSRSQMNVLTGSFRDAWSARHATGRGNASLSLSAGGRGLLGGAPLGWLGSFTYANGLEVRRDLRRALAVSNGAAGTRPQDAYFGSAGTASVLWGGILNLTTQLGPATTLAFENTYTRTADNQATRLAGTSEQYGNDRDITRLAFTERFVRSSQLRADHHVGERHTVSWAVSSSTVRRYEPDRSEVVYVATIDTVRRTSRPLWWWDGSPSATRTFSDLRESAVELSSDYKLAWGVPGTGSALKLGVRYRSVDRTDDSRAFDLYGVDLTDAERTAAPEAIFDGGYAAAGRLLLSLNANAGRYTAVDRLAAGYAQLELGLGERLRLIGGARVEDNRLRLHTLTAQGLPSDAAPRYVDLLPAASLTFRLTQAQNLRLSASQTLSRPEYREISIAPHYDEVGEYLVFGNPALQRARIQNYDARWEWYPTPAEVVSAGVFAKSFDHPIEKVIVGTTGAPALSFVNAAGAHTYGIEVEIRKNLGSFAPALLPLTAFTNTTLMHSRIEPGNAGISSNTNAARPMQGQAGYVVNAGVSYTDRSGRLSATGLYNVVGRRIVQVGQLPLPDAYELARHGLDVSAQAQLGPQLAVKLDGKNLLDAPHRITQGSVTRMSYRAGRIFALGVTLNP